MRRVCILILILAAPLSVATADDYIDPEITPAEKAHWAFRTVVRPALPSLRDQKWVRTPADVFIQHKLEAARLTPAPVADRLTLCRRLYLDLLGLPPTPAEIDAFLSDQNPDAYEKLVERLLASPHYGERWGTHWLDVVRFAESNGYEADGVRPHAWRYRDYVVKSFNEDKPYNVFLTEQIAGDEIAIAKGNTAPPELWVPTGMHRCGPVHMVSGNLDPEVVRQEVLTEMVNGLGTATMGLTVGCARCHDHKFDPISLGDYYRLQAFFAAARYVDVEFATDEEKTSREKAIATIAARITPLRKQVSEIDAPIKARLTQAKREALELRYKVALAVPADQRTPEQKKLVSETGPLLKVTWDEVLAALSREDRGRRESLRQQIHALEATLPPPSPSAWAIKDSDNRPESFVLKRGNAKGKWSAVNAAFPRVLTSNAIQPQSRLELAKWLTQPHHPLTARVIVNRIWQHHFGRGIVATPNDFGTRGAQPTHPELLDWLAKEFVEPTWHPAGQKAGQPWQLKQIHRLIVLSATYRQASRETAEAHKLDPDNKLLSHMPRRRLEAEAIRDSVLTASGELNRTVGGPSVRVPLEPEVYDLIFTEGEPDGLWLVTPDVRQHARRSIYLFNKRNVRLPILEAFDQPDTLNSCAVRPVSTFAPQALILMNGPFVQEQGKALAVRIVGEVGEDRRRQIDSLYRRAYGRNATEEELQLALAFLDEQAASFRDRLRARLPIGLPALALPGTVDLAGTRALADLCVVVFNTSEFAYIP